MAPPFASVLAVVVLCPSRKREYASALIDVLPLSAAVPAGLPQSLLQPAHLPLHFVDSGIRDISSMIDVAPMPAVHPAHHQHVKTAAH